MGKKKTKKQKERVGYNIPNDDQLKSFSDKLIKLDDGVYIAPSFTHDESGYMVDMSNDFCSYSTGRDDAPCKHQYGIWVNNPDHARNFLPIFSKYERQKYATIAYGESLPIEFYEGLHDT